MAVYTPTFTSIDYRPAGANNGKQYFDVYHPTIGAPPYPTLVYFDLGGFTSSNRPASLTGAASLQGLALDQGWAVVMVEVTVYGVGVGNGMFWRPGDIYWDIDGTQHDNAFLDATWVIQHLRLNAATYDIDPDVMVTNGRSAGSQCAGWVALGKDHADAGSAIAQSQESSRVAGTVMSTPQTYWAAFAQAKIGPSPNVFWLRKQGDELNPCLELQYAYASHKIVASMTYGLTPTAAMEVYNSTTPCYILVQADELAATCGALDWTFDATTYVPAMVGTTTTGITDAHHPWHGVMLMKMLRHLSPFHGAHSRIGSSGPFAFSAEYEMDAEFAGGLDGSATRQDILSWMTTEFLNLGGVASLNLRMDWGNEVKVACTGLVTDKAGGMVQGRQTHSAYSRWTGDLATRTWTVNWKSASRTEHDLLLEIWKESLGGALPINFTPPDEAVTLARFVGGSFSARQDGPQRFAIACTLEEVL